MKPNPLYSVSKKKNKATQSRAFGMIGKQSSTNCRSLLSKTPQVSCEPISQVLTADPGGCSGLWGVGGRVVPSPPLLAPSAVPSPLWPRREAASTGRGSPGCAGVPLPASPPVASPPPPRCLCPCPSRASVYHSPLMLATP